MWDELGGRSAPMVRVAAVWGGLLIMALALLGARGAGDAWAPWRPLDAVSIRREHAQGQLHTMPPVEAGTERWLFIGNSLLAASIGGIVPGELPSRTGATPAVAVIWGPGLDLELFDVDPGKILAARPTVLALQLDLLIPYQDVYRQHHTELPATLVYRPMATRCSVEAKARLADLAAHPGLEEGRSLAAGRRLIAAAVAADVRVVVFDAPWSESMHRAIPEAVHREREAIAAGLVDGGLGERVPPGLPLPDHMFVDCMHGGPDAGVVWGRSFSAGLAAAWAR